MGLAFIALGACSSADILLKMMSWTRLEGCLKARSRGAGDISLKV